MANEMLSLETEKAVRTYVFKLLIPLSAALAGITFVLGFIISQYANIKAATSEYNVLQDAQVRVNRFIEQSYEDQQKFTREIMKEEVKAKQTLDRIKGLTTQAENLDNKIRKLQSIKTNEEIIDGLKISLKNDIEFMKDLNLDANSDLKKLTKKNEQRITDLEKRFSKNILWGVNTKNNIFWSEDKGDNWHRVDGSLKQISVGDGIVWGVNAKDEIFWSNDKGANWNRVNGKLKQISTWP
jgi:uncharacterized protein YlaN (UPF0358 family)